MIILGIFFALVALALVALWLDYRAINKRRGE